MAQTLGWGAMKERSARLLKERTGEDLDTWNRRIQELGPEDDKSLRAWLAEQGVTGYAQSLLVMERFGYPDFLLASADELVAAQYADRPQLRPIYDAHRRRRFRPGRGCRPDAQDLCVAGHPAPDVRPGAGHHPEARRSRPSSGGPERGRPASAFKGA